MTTLAAQRQALAEQAGTVSARLAALDAHERTLVDSIDPAAGEAVDRIYGMSAKAQVATPYLTALNGAGTAGHAPTGPAMGA